jgi:NAD(P)-dependent dehydrogenase (short-subunit alcohol dehydrogenase family)
MLTQPLPASQRTARGTIINIASMLGVVSTNTKIPAPAYVTSKHAVIGLTRADAAVYAGPDTRIKINALCPGYILTPALAAVTTTAKAEGKESPMQAEIDKTPMQRLGEIEEIADAAVYLASDMSSFMSGAALVVDG